MNTILAKLLVFNYTDKLKWLHDLVVGICWSVNEVVIVIIQMHRVLNSQYKCLQYTNFLFFLKAM